LSLFGPNILLSTLFSNTLSLCTSLHVRDQVSKITIFQLTVRQFIPMSLNIKTIKLFYLSNTTQFYSGISLAVFNKLCPGCVQGSRKIKLYSYR
jgi:hypothetical protein